MSNWTAMLQATLMIGFLAGVYSVGYFKGYNTGKHNQQLLEISKRIAKSNPNNKEV